MLIEDMLKGIKSDLSHKLLVTSKTENVTQTSQYDFHKCNFQSKQKNKTENFLYPDLPVSESLIKDQSIIAVLKKKMHPQVEEIIVSLIQECVSKATWTGINNKSGVSLKEDLDCKTIAETTKEIEDITNSKTAVVTINALESLDNTARLYSESKLSKGIADTISTPSKNNGKDSIAEPNANASIDDISLVTSAVETLLSQDGSDSDSGVSSMSAGTSPTTDVDDSESTRSCLPARKPAVKEVFDIMAMEIQYEGHDILDLSRTLLGRPWNLQPTRLPLMNLEMFWQNRSQYHRLGDYGQEQHKQLCCIDCKFQYPVPN